jgi:hypothetical protein
MTDDTRDSDELAADHARSSVERANDHRADVRFTNVGPRRRRTLYLSEEVFRDGEPVRLEEVIVVDDEISGGDVPEAPAGDPFWSPDRRTDPYGWELYWRSMMRHDLRAGQWRASKPWKRVTWYCEHCRQPIPDVKSKGRPPKWCSRACQQAAYVARKGA